MRYSRSGWHYGAPQHLVGWTFLLRLGAEAFPPRVEGAVWSHWHVCYMTTTKYRIAVTTYEAKEMRRFAGLCMHVHAWTWIYLTNILLPAPRYEGLHRVEQESGSHNPFNRIWWSWIKMFQNAHTKTRNLKLFTARSLSRRGSWTNGFIMIQTIFLLHMLIRIGLSH